MLTERYSNRYAVQHGLDYYRDAMRQFIMAGLAPVRGMSPAEAIRSSLRGKAASDFSLRVTESGVEIPDAFDECQFPRIINHYWDISFSQRVTGTEPVVRNFRKWLWEIVRFRAEAAHPTRQDLSTEQAQECLQKISEALTGINALSTVSEIAALLDGLTSPETASATGTQSSSDSTLLPRESATDSNSNRNTRQQSTATEAESAQRRGRKPWREAIQPHPDVIQGTLQPSEFAADLQQVYDGLADDNLYGNPVLFFRHTYMTDGIRDLLTATIQRLTGYGGFPVVQAKTGFGGGKTHSLIALYHLVTSASELVFADGDPRDDVARKEIQTILESAGVPIEEGIKANIAVLNGIHLSPTDNATTHEKSDPLNTLWGVMAYQLGGQAGYDAIGGAAREGTAPGGGQLRNLFSLVGPCVILMDEIINYARNVSGDARIETIYTFFQNLTEAIRQTNNVAMVISLPESEVEVGDEHAAEILRRLETILGRVEAVWRPVEDREGFEVVRRRLFRDETCDNDAREKVCQAFSEMYSRRNNRTKFPAEVTRPEYTQQLYRCYPIHPEIFDRLYEDWSTYHNFQRTRGVLRIMALCVNRLYHQDDGALLIMPGDLPLGDANLSGEFIRLLSPHWNPVMDEVDREDSRTDLIDTRRNDFRQIRPARRMARTIFLGSVPVRPNPGLDDRHIYLGATAPGVPISTYDAALRTMDEQLYHLYRENGRHRFSSDVKLGLVANERKGEFNDQDTDDEIVRRLNETCSDGNVIVCPNGSDDVPDQNQVQIVVLPPDQMRGPRARETDRATPLAAAMTTTCGDAPRKYRSSLMFLATSTDLIRPLRDAARNVLAWESIINGERKIMHLTEQRHQEASDERNNARNDFDKTLAYSYRYVAIPRLDQIDESGEVCTFEWESIKNVSRDSNIAENIERIIQTNPLYQPQDILEPENDVYTDTLNEPNLSADTLDESDSLSEIDLVAEPPAMSDDGEPVALNGSSDEKDISQAPISADDSQHSISYFDPPALGDGVEEATVSSREGAAASSTDADSIPVTVQLRFTPLNTGEALESRLIGNGLANELRQSGSLVSIIMTITASKLLEDIPRGILNSGAILADDSNQSISEVSFILKAENQGGIADGLMQDIRDLASSKRFVALEITGG